MLDAKIEREESILTNQITANEVYFAAMFSMVNNQLENVTKALASKYRPKMVKFDELLSDETKKRIKEQDKKIIVPAEIDVLKCLIPS